MSLITHSIEDMLLVFRSASAPPTLLRTVVYLPDKKSILCNAKSRAVRNRS